MKPSNRQIAAAAMGAALIAVCSWLSVPSVVPFTLQTFAVCLVAALFGWRLGLWTAAVYLLMGTVGLPVFAGFKGGAASLLGPTGGYLIGFLFTAFIVGLAADRLGRTLPVLIVSMALGIAVCYAFGTAWFVLVYTRTGGVITLGAALAMCVIPYLIPDALKIALASILARRLHPLLRKGWTA